MMLSEIGERRIIEELKKFLDIGDDAAYIRFGYKYLILTTDMIYQETHILKQMTWEQIGMLIVTVNLSDIAAMGAKPVAFLLGYGSPDISFDNFKTLIKAVKKQCERFDTKFVGGDTNQTEKLTLSGTLIGISEKPVLRSNARVGDIVAITGDLGSASLGTRILMKDGVNKKKLKNPVFKKALEPEPRVKEGLILSKYVNSMTDISDGLSISIRDIAESSNVGIEIELDKIPIDDRTFNLAIENGEDIMKHALYGEGDYELLFTINKKNFEIIRNILSVYKIGRVTKNKEIAGVDSKGVRFRIERGGYEHFKSKHQKEKA
ncbi:MAG: thiamine-phosphate kinase [Candidatus Altiarchaeales archaeon]|nr:MAG: thiamine-phosphate kinase [Candidatus Altiarchaeales archaeon]